ncbi:MAG: PEP-CTERM sorting domain-containing protein [Rhodoferax sp.]|nr:PEP-CTERM sorting domain-containing protein [Rhodoferax sp.]
MAAALAGGLVSPSLASAKTVTWTGGAAFVSTDWLYAFNGFTNWLSSQQPANGDSLVFDGAVGLTNRNNGLSSIANLSFAAGAGAFTLNGSGLSVTGNLANYSNHLQTINLPLTVGASGATWDGGSQGLQLNGDFTLGSHSLTLSNKIAIDNAGRDVTVGWSGAATLGLTGGSKVHSATGRIADTQNSAGTVNVEGTGSSWTISSDLYVGNRGTGRLYITSGGQVSNTNGYIGQDYFSSGEVIVSGKGSTWTNRDRLYVGYHGDGKLTIGTGGTVRAGYLKIDGRGVVLQGGSLIVDDVNNPSNSQFDWQSGTLNYTGNVSLGNGMIGLEAAQSLATGQTLKVDRTLKIGAGTVLLLNGGRVESGALSLVGGSVIETSGLDVSDTGNITGHGLISGAISGGAGNRIDVSGGTLTLGALAAAGGYRFDGTLDIGSQDVAILSADQARLGSLTTMGAGGRLSTVHGAELGVGKTLTFAGNASIQGDFTNNGAVSGSGGALTFFNDVNGAGSFAGDIVFRAGYSPGNSPAAVSFNAGNASYDGTSVLTLEILGAAPGSGYDQLVDIDHLNFDGTLQLVFGGGYVAVAGTRFTLFDFQSFSGSLSSGHIQVVGFDAARLDFSQLTTAGTLSVAAVPEPETYALMLAGLGVVGWVARRRQCRAV